MTQTPANVNKNTIEDFYSSFSRRDFAGMATCYHSHIEFSDPVFSLHGKSAQAMWHMLCESGSDLVVTYRNIEVQGETGRAHWEAFYTFSSTGRKVHNIIAAEFQFQSGKIIKHTDRFNFWRWSHLALGSTGTFLGWTPTVKNKVRATAMARLEKFIAKHPEYQGE